MILERTGLLVMR